MTTIDTLADAYARANADLARAAVYRAAAADADARASAHIADAYARAAADSAYRAAYSSAVIRNS